MVGNGVVGSAGPLLIEALGHDILGKRLRESLVNFSLVLLACPVMDSRDVVLRTIFSLCSVQDLPCRQFVRELDIFFVYLLKERERER